MVRWRSMADQTWRSRGGLAIAGGVALGELLLTSCALPGTTAPVGNVAVHVAGVPAVAAPPTIAISPVNAAQSVGLDAPITVTVATGHLDTVSVTEVGSSVAVHGMMSADGRTWQMTDALDQKAHYTVVATASSTAGSTSNATATFGTVAARSRLLTGMTPLNGETVGVGETINLRFNTSIPADRRAALLQR